MRQLKRTEYQSVRTNGAPTVSLGCSGTITLNPETCKTLGVNAGDRVILLCDNAGDYLIGKAKSKEDDEAYVLRSSGTKSLRTLTFNASAVVKEIVQEKDLALANNKRKSMRFNLVTNANVKWNGYTLYEISI